jgi:hypothetical protein
MSEVKVLLDIPQSTLDYWDRVGKLLGYPECCVKDFLIPMLPRRRSVFSGTGFIPCEACNNRDQAELWREINNNRHKDLPEFPTDDAAKLVIKLLHTL